MTTVLRLDRTTVIRLVLLAVLFLAPRALHAQSSAPLEAFVASVARLWAQGDADGIARLAPSDGRILLDLEGDGPGEVQERNAAAALRRLFGGRETVSTRATQVTVAGGTPARGFGELSWVARQRGVADTRQTVVYVGAVWENGAWHLRELRILR